MKNLKLKTEIITALVVIVISAAFVSGCSRQEKKDTAENKQQKTDTTLQNNVKQDNSSLTESQNTGKNTGAKNNIRHETIKIPSAQCDICKGKITKAIKKVNGVKSFDVDVDNHVVHANFDNTLTDLSKIEKAITSAGYDANDKKADPEAYSKLDECCKRPEDRNK